MKEVLKINCPVCKEELIAREGSSLYLCIDPKEIMLDDYNKILKYYDCAIQVLNNEFIYQQYDVPPYRIIIRKDISDETTVTEILKINEIVWDDMISTYPRAYFNSIARLNTELNLPWHDCDKCIEKIKNLILFS